MARFHRRYRRGAIAGDKLVSMVGAVLERRVPREDLRLAQLGFVLDKVLPSGLRGRAQAIRLERNILWIAVSDAQWLHELQYLRQPIFDELRARWPELAPSGLRLVHGRTSPGSARPEAPVAGSPDVPRAVPPPRPQGDPGPVAPELLTALGDVEDGDLRDLLATLCMNWLERDGHEERRG